MCHVSESPAPSAVIRRYSGLWVENRMIDRHTIANTGALSYCEELAGEFFEPLKVRLQTGAMYGPDDLRQIQSYEMAGMLGRNERP